MIARVNLRFVCPSSSFLLLRHDSVDGHLRGDNRAGTGSRNRVHSQRARIAGGSNSSPRVRDSSSDHFYKFDLPLAWITREGICVVGRTANQVLLFAHSRRHSEKDEKRIQKKITRVDRRRLFPTGAEGKKRRADKGGKSSAVTCREISSRR